MEKETFAKDFFPGYSNAKSLTSMRGFHYPVFGLINDYK